MPDASFRASTSHASQTHFFCYNPRVVVGYLVSAADIRVNRVLKGILVAFLVLLPIAVLIGAKEPVSLIPITVMTLILGAGVGFLAGQP